MRSESFGDLVISELQSCRWISQLFDRLIDTIYARNSFLEWNTVRYRMRTDLSPVAYCCTLKATRFARWMHLWPPIDGMKSGRRQGASTAPLPVPYPGPVSGKEGRARVLWSRASSIEYPIETVSSRGRICYYYILAIDFIGTAESTWSEHSAPKINTPHWIRK